MWNCFSLNRTILQGEKWKIENFKIRTSGPPYWTSNLWKKYPYPLYPESGNDTNKYYLLSGLVSFKIVFKDCFASDEKKINFTILHIFNV